MLWKLFSSDKRVEEALEWSTMSYDLSPAVLEPAPLQRPANNDEPVESTVVSLRPKSRLWLEDWDEKDEERMRDPSRTFGIMWS